MIFLYIYVGNIFSKVFCMLQILALALQDFFLLVFETCAFNKKN